MAALGTAVKMHKTVVTTGDGKKTEKTQRRGKGQETGRSEEGAGRVEEERRVSGREERGRRSGQTDRKGTGRDVAGASSSAKALLGSP